MSEHRIIVHGRPVPKGRPRFDPRSGRAYTPKETAAWERTIKRTATLVSGGKRIDGEVSVDVLIVHPDRRHGDVDNYVKAVLDACQGVLFGDDKCVCAITARRKYDNEHPRVEVCVRGAGA